MAEAAAVHPCHFRWNILNPFVPWRRMEATFYHGSPTPTQCRVILEPLHRSTNFWVFRFSLKSGKEFDIIFADRLEVDISINGKNMDNKVETNYYFQSTNRHKYEFETNVLTHPLKDAPHHLAIEVEISFPSRNIVNQGNGFLFDENDLEQLSGDLMELYTNSLYSNLLLRSRDPPSNHLVHYCIMQARWSDFFRVHPLHTIIDNTIEINISDILLRDVLTYVYSGTFHVAGPNWENPDYTTELFQVIDRYNLHHLYNVFARRDPQQVRRTKKHLDINTKKFRLDGADGLPLNDPSFTWNVNSNGAYDFTFRIQFFLSPANPSFLYSLQSRSPLRIYAQVNLEFMEVFVGRSTVVRTVHARDFTIDSNESVESGPCHFEGHSGDLNGFIKGKRRSWRGIRIKHFARCILYLSDGTAVIEVLRVDDERLQDDRERLNVLSDHMYELMLRPDHHNLRVLCPADRPRYPGNPNECFWLHKSIFAIRVPEWEAVLGNVLQGDAIPGVVSLNMRSEAFRPLLAYIYLGKIFPIPLLYLDEVDDFAELGGMNSLRNLVNRMRLDAQYWFFW